jgi:hypothetical protein
VSLGDGEGGHYCEEEEGGKEEDEGDGARRGGALLLLLASAERDVAVAVCVLLEDIGLGFCDCERACEAGEGLAHRSMCVLDLDWTRLLAGWRCVVCEEVMVWLL